MVVTGSNACSAVEFCMVVVEPSASLLNSWLVCVPHNTTV